MGYIAHRQPRDSGSGGAARQVGGYTNGASHQKVLNDTTSSCGLPFHGFKPQSHQDLAVLGNSLRIAR